jgi:hypothetical protein
MDNEHRHIYHDYIFFGATVSPTCWLYLGGVAHEVRHKVKAKADQKSDRMIRLACHQEVYTYQHRHSGETV